MNQAMAEWLAAEGPMVALLILVVAFVLTVLSAFGVGHPKIDLFKLGVALFILTFALGRYV